MVQASVDPAIVEAATSAIGSDRIGISRGSLLPLANSVEQQRRLRHVGGAVALGVLLATIVVAISTRGQEAGMDFSFYREIGVRWLADGTFYTERQLADQPYEIVAMSDVLYPPTALALFVPFVFLPAPLWWLIPLGVIAFVVWTYRPSPWAWVGILALIAWPRTFGAVLFGNTDMWVAAGVAAGLRWGWPASLILIKPTFLPLAIVGIRHRSTWVVGAVLAVLTAPLAMDYLRAMSNLRLDGIAYAAVSLPFVVIPLVAWAGRERQTTPALHQQVPS